MTQSSIDTQVLHRPPRPINYHHQRSLLSQTHNHNSLRLNQIIHSHLPLHRPKWHNPRQLKLSQRQQSLHNSHRFLPLRQINLPLLLLLPIPIPLPRPPLLLQGLKGMHRQQLFQQHPPQHQHLLRDPKFSHPTKLVRALVNHSLARIRRKTRRNFNSLIKAAVAHMRTIITIDPSMLKSSRESSPQMPKGPMHFLFLSISAISSESSENLKQKDWLLIFLVFVCSYQREFDRMAKVLLNLKLENARLSQKFPAFVSEISKALDTFESKLQFHVRELKLDAERLTKREAELVKSESSIHSTLNDLRTFLREPKTIQF
jgi:hypothetical protein